jgi:hypothetical protein
MNASHCFEARLLSSGQGVSDCLSSRTATQATDKCW